MAEILRQRLGGIDVLCDEEPELLGQRHRTLLPALGQSEHELAADDLHLPLDIDHTAQEVDMLNGQTERLTLPKTTARGDIKAPLNRAHQDQGVTTVTGWARAQSS